MMPPEVHDPELNDQDEALDASPDSRVRARKAPNAFRTISEVADDLHIPQHVLRFWETKFPQVKPLKRGGGRRYYRPEDITLLRRISGLLYVQGYTIKGVQRLLREGGGHLSDNIPPPAPDEKAEDPQAEREAATHDEAQLPMPGLVASAPVSAGPLPTSHIKVGITPPRQASRPRAELAHALVHQDQSADLGRLRSLLQATLADLETLRALLP